VKVLSITKIKKPGGEKAPDFDGTGIAPLLIANLFIPKKYVEKCFFLNISRHRRGTACRALMLHHNGLKNYSTLFLIDDIFVLTKAKKNLVAPADADKLVFGWRQPKETCP
jgi:hypothetical protein